MTARDATEILIVEDSPTQAERLRHILEQQGYRVRRAANGREALEEVQHHAPALVISDVIMPEMDGYELCGRLKDEPRSGDMPVILVTTLSDPGDVIRGLECRADNFIVKPYDAQYLISRVQFVLMNHAMRQAQQGGLAVEIFFNEQRHVITADRLQILNLLLSTYDAAIQRNKELSRAQEQILRTETFLNSIIENVPSAIFVKEVPAMRFVRMNRAFEELFGYARSELLGKTVDDTSPPDEAAIFRVQDRDALDRRQLIDIPEERVSSRTRGMRILHTRKVPILDEQGEPRYLLGITDDITQRKASEHALAAAKLEAERANHAKSDFLARMSHDLRTPLNAILGFAQLLELDSLRADQFDNVEHIRKAGALLLDLIDEVLDFARLESGHMSLSLEPVDIGDAVQQVVALIRPMAAQRDIVIEDAAVTAWMGRHVRADRQRLNQVLLNLLSNAVKYNRAGGCVRVSCEEGCEGHLRINVSDTGAGIPREKMALLFQPFERLGAEQTAIQGTGLGLALSKALAEAMAGTLGAESEVDRGSTFWVELPAAQPTPDAASATDLRRHAAAGDSGVTGTVLYIEDNSSNRRLMERLVARRAGVRLVAVEQGQAGLDLAQADPPDLILLDLHLPDMHGEEVLRRLREDARTREIPVAVLSADASVGQSHRALAAGATAYLTKPIDVREVLQLIDDSLASQ